MTGDMMSDMLLDRAKDMPTPDGYKAIESEVDFLRFAIGGMPLLVRGESLCQWAETFCNGRRIPYRELLSPTQMLRELVPSLREAEAQAIRAVLPDQLATRLQQLNLTGLLQALFPNALWEERPSITHAADWLLWLYEKTPDSVFEPLFAENGRRWQRDIDNATHTLYDATNAVSACHLLERWLGLPHDPVFIELGVFPHTLPERLRTHATNILKDQIITKHGTLIGELETQPVPLDLRRLTAQETVNYLIHNPRDLTPNLRDQLTPYLTQDEQNCVLALMPPAMPELPPEQPEAVLDWFRHQYMPARQWQSTHGSDAESEKISTTAEQFAQWYLHEYPRALNGGWLQQHLSFNRAASNQQQKSHITLYLVLDGLHVLDARRLLDYLHQETKRLTVWEDGLVFTPLPTITEVCKPALFAGVPPKLAHDVAALGIIVPEKENPAEKLSGASPGEFYLWRILEPDSTYHKQNSSATLHEEIKGRLSSIASKITAMVNQVPVELPLRLIITTDHGRLLAKATRVLNVPAEMQSQGRAALGVSRRQFDERGFLIEDDIVYLHAARFGLSTDAAVSLRGDTFRTNDGKTGSEWYPHGGLYPEEVIVPWIELVRDATMPAVTVTLRGSGQAGQSGQFILQLRNPGDISVTAVALSLLIAGQPFKLPINQAITPYSEQTFTLSWSSWLKRAEVSQTTVTLSLQLPNGLSFTVPIANPEIESIEMYRRDNNLGDLDL
ncbi:MAG: hypothetical protein KC423_02440 [Anaerolineales bacterium]|nr:hypothetical protein [Anaerolineales bacterium]MCA9963066.1 hypothetical protein [Anaerolineales bacterium]